jgi:hypothetical protein
MFATDTRMSIWDNLEFGSAEAVEAEEIRRQLRAEEAEISKHRAKQVALLREADRLQLDTADGAMSMRDWVVSELDVSPQIAHRLMLVASSEQADIEAEMTGGVYGLDRASFLCQLRALGGPEQVIGDSLQYSLGYLFGLVDRLRRVSREDEQITFDDRYLVLQDSLDSTGGRFWGQTVGTDWESIKQALHRRESRLPALPTQNRGQRAADALASICLDSLTGTSGENDGGEHQDRAVVVAEVFVDAALAGPSGGEAGVTLSFGPRVGPNTLAELLCTGQIQVIIQGEEGRPIGVSDRGEAIPQRYGPMSSIGIKVNARWNVSAATGSNPTTSNPEEKAEPTIRTI